MHNRAIARCVLRKFIAYASALSLLGATPGVVLPSVARGQVRAVAYRGGGRGGRVATGPRGGQAAVGPRGGVAATGPRGGEAARGPYGGAAVRGPEGGAAARGPYGGAAARGPAGNVATRGGGYAYHGHDYYRPGWSGAQVNVYGRGFVGYLGWHPYGTYGLAPGLAAFTGLAFLSTGLLIGSYAHGQQTVYVYVVEEDGVKKEYRVDDQGNVLSTKVVTEPAK
jgi:hypothetical protein